MVVSMGKIILTYNDVCVVNQLLQDKKIHFKMHLHDSCGTQSYTMEPLNEVSGENIYEEMKHCISEYFNNRGIDIRFFDNHLGFTIIQ
jgi:hypothetical protein